MSDFKEQCIALRKKDYSIIEIMRETGRAKSSVYMHIKDLPMSRERMASYRVAAGKQIREFALARKGKSVRQFKPFKKWTTGSVSLVAHLLFGGSIDSQRGCAYSNRSAALLQKVEELMRSVYVFEPARYQDPITGVYRLSYYNVALGTFMGKKVDDLLNQVPKLPIRLKIELVRAFFDDEGCMDFRPKSKVRKIRGYQKDFRVLELIKILLDDLHILARVVLPNEVVIVGKNNLVEFEKRINFSPGVYMNGNRSNSRWKKHIEKRELLRQAIKSFKN
jgi:hypothetical protein